MRVLPPETGGPQPRTARHRTVRRLQRVPTRAQERSQLVKHDGTGGRAVAARGSHPLDGAVPIPTTPRRACHREERQPRADR